MFSSVFTVFLVSWLNSFPLEAVAKTSEKRCYTVDLTGYFNIPGGTSMTESEARAQLQQLVTGISAIMPFDSRCWFVSVTLGHVAVNSGLQVTTIRAKFIFSAESTVLSNQVASTVSGCIDAVKRHQGGLSHMITVNSRGLSVPVSRLTISDKKSCCGQAPPPCNVTSTTSFPISPSSPVRSLSTFTIVPGNPWNSYQVVKRCYKVNVSLLYNIPGGVALTETDVRQKLDPALKAAKQMLPLLGTCNAVTVSVAHIFVPAPHASNVEIAATLFVIADSTVQDNQVHHTLSNCMSTLRGFQSLLASNAPPINVNGTTYQAMGSSISNGESCCSPNPPPCTLLISTHVGPLQTAGPEKFSSIGTPASSVIVTSSITSTDVNIIKSSLSGSPLTVSSRMTTVIESTRFNSVSTEFTTTNVGSSNLPTTKASTDVNIIKSSPSGSPLTVSSRMTTVIESTPFNSVSTEFITTNVGSSNLPTNKAMTSPPALTTSAILADLEKRCYSVQVILSLKTSGPINLTVSDVRSQLQSSLGSAGSMLALIPTCHDVSLTLGNISVFPPKDRSVAIGATLLFSADNKIPRSAVASQISGCITAIRGLKNLLSVSLRTIVVKGVQYQIQNINIMEKKSCCGDVEPPCFLSDGIEIVNLTPNVSVNVGEDLEAHCRVKYPSPRVKVTWLRNGKRIPLTGGAVDGDKRVVVRDGSIIIAAATTMDAGIYTCVASGPRGSVMRNITVQVRTSQEFEVTLILSSETYNSDLENKSSARYHQLASIVTQELENKFRGEVQGFHRIEVLRFREGSVLVDFLLITMVSVNKPVDEPPNMRQKIERSVFKVLRSGNLGRLSVLSGSLVFSEKPPPPINIAVKERSVEKVHLEWSHPEYHEVYRIQSYVIRYYRSSRPNDTYNSSVAASHREFVLKELEQGTEYEIRMSSTNSKGEGRLSDPIRVSTKANENDDKRLLIIKIVLPAAGGLLIVFAAITFYCWRTRLANTKESTKRCKTSKRSELLVTNPTFDQKPVA